jgi:hypothetical protein
MMEETVKSCEGVLFWTDFAIDAGMITAIILIIMAMLRLVKASLR